MTLPLTRNSTPDVIERVANMLECFDTSALTEDDAGTLSGLILTLRVTADLERKGIK